MAVKGQGSQTVIDLTDGFSVSLSQDSASWNGTKDNLGTQQTVAVTVTAYQGASVAPSYSVGTPTRTDTANCTASVSGNTVNIVVKAAATTGGSVTIPVTISTNGESIVINKTFSYSVILKGATGAQGPQGVQGPQGEQGEQGPQGETGDDGAPAINVAVVGNTTLRNNSGSTTLTAYVYVGGSPATVASNGTVTYNGSTIGTIKWYKGSATSGTAGQTCTISASEVTNSMVVYAKLEG